MTAAQDWFAVIGLAGRFPGAASPAALWEMLCEGRSGIASFTDEQLIASGVPRERLADPDYVKARGALDGTEYFDASFFGCVPAEAALLDPQQRLFLECAWEALEHAGYGRRARRPTVGVFASASASRYQLHLIERLGAAAREPFVLDGTLGDFLALRAAYKLDLHGPAVTVQSACSGSLVALHLACQSLLLGESDIALAGAASVAVPVREGRLWQEGSISSRDGQCRPFDADATGTVGGDAVVAVVLRRFDDAIRDRDFIHAVVRGSAINNDGADKVGFTAPSVGGQARAIRAALSLAGVAPADLGYIEAHGSATRLGDPIEIAALCAALDGVPPGTIPIGSIKSNIGHTDTAAGLSGLIKTALCLRERTRVPSLGFARPNPLLDLPSTPFRVQTACEVWPDEGRPRRAGVSSFGMGGTNVHVILEEPPARPPARSTRDWHLLPISARSRPALEQMTTRLSEHLRAHPDLAMSDVAFTLQIGRESFEHRRAVVARTAGEAAELLATRDPTRVITGVARPDRRVAFLYPGLGDGAFHGVADLHRHNPVFRAALDHCAERLLPQIGVDVRHVLFAPAAMAAPALRAAKRRDTPGVPTRIAQPTVFALSWSLHALWTSLAVTPDLLAGHSLGEYVAATAAGVFSLDDALDLVAARALLLDELPPGAMTAVGLGAEALTALHAPGISVAVVSSRDACVAAGAPEDVDALEARLGDLEVAFRRLDVAHAFHTSAMRPAAVRLAPALLRARRSSPQIAVFSNVTGQLHDACSALDAKYWCEQLAQPVVFAPVVNALADDPARVTIQVGPGAQLVQLARMAADGARDRVSTTSLPEAGDGIAHWLTAVARLWISGVDIDWTRLDETAPHGRVPLPTYAFERKRHWVDRQPGATISPAPARPNHVAGEPAHAAGEPVHAAGEPVHAGPDTMAGRSEREQALLAIWRTSFGVDAIGLDDDFFALGGHSLLALQLLHRLNRTHGVDFSVRDLVEHSTIAKLAAHWAATTASETAEAATPRMTAERLRQSPPQDRARLADEYMAGVVARALGAPPARIAHDQELGPLGLAANLADIVRACKRDFGLVIHPHEVVGRRTIAGLGRLLLEALGLSTPAPDVPASAAAPERPSPPSAAPVARNPPIAFLLSSARSGSTLLRVMLAGHPRLFCPPELHLLMHATLRQRDARLSSPHFGSGLPRALMELLPIDASHAGQRVEEWLARDLATPEVYRELQLLARPRLLIDKSPSYAESLDTLIRIDEWFASSYLIVLVRHPYAVMESYVRNRIGAMAHPATVDAWQQAERHWVTTYLHLCQFLDAAPRPWHLVRYEELVTMPEPTLRAVCTSLGVDYHPAVLTPYQGRRMIDGPGDPNLHEHDGVEAGLADRWREVELPGALDDQTRHLAERFGYDIPGVTS